MHSDRTTTVVLTGSEDTALGPGLAATRGLAEASAARCVEASPISPVTVDDQIVGLVVANPQTTWEQLGPALLIVGFILVAGATTSAALLIFGPVRRRLGSLEDAARKVGSGDLTARAAEDGGDEVTALAHTFNQMTIDLAARAEQLRNVDQQRRILFADVSHELMTPLTAMRGYLESLSMSGIAIDAGTRAKYLSIVGDEACRMEHIVRDLLDVLVCRITAGEGLSPRPPGLFRRRDGIESTSSGITLL